METLDVAIYAKRVGLVKVAGVGRVLRFDWTKVVPIDWNAALTKVNQCYDRLVEAAKLPTRSAQKRALKEFQADLTAEARRAYDPSRVCAALFSEKIRGELIGSIIVSFMQPWDEAKSAIEMQDRANTDLELTRLAAALAVFRAEHGQYPAKLTDLVPRLIRRLPVDHYNAKPIIYKRTSDGYLLYSVGDNGVDDGGSCEKLKYEGRDLDDMSDGEKSAASAKIPSGADDLSIRTPRPLFELPPLKQSTNVEQ